MCGWSKLSTLCVLSGKTTSKGAGAGSQPSCLAQSSSLPSETSVGTRRSLETST